MKRFLCMVLSVTITLSLGNIVVAAELSDNDNMTVSESIVDQDMATGIEVYGDLLNMFYDKITAGWQQTEDVSYLFYWPYSDVQTASDAGYALMDLNNDGIEELLVSSIQSAAIGAIYDLYTYADGEIIHLATSGERSDYYLMDNNKIYLEGSSGALCSSWEVYTIDIENKMLKVEETVLYDGYTDENNPWFWGNADDCAEENGDLRDNMIHISESEAKDKINNYKTIGFSLNTFDNYHPQESSDISMDSVLRQNLMSSIGEENLIYFICDDFDANGTVEALGITGNVAGDYLENAKIYAVDDTGSVSCMQTFDYLCGYGGTTEEITEQIEYNFINVNNIKFLVLGGIDGDKTWLFGFKLGQPYQPVISGQYSYFYKTDNGLFCAESNQGGAAYYQYYYEFDQETEEFVQCG